MFRRWLIRSMALTLLTLCVVAGVGSYWREIVVYEGRRDFQRGPYFAGRLFFLSCDAGRIIATDRTVYEFAVFDWDIQANYHILGFCFFRSKFPECTEIMIPLWFPTLLSALLLWLAWWKTQAKPKGGAFPVEVAVKTEGMQT